MTLPSSDHPRAATDSYFARKSPFWRDIYGGSDLRALIYQERFKRALDCIEQLGLPPGSRALEIGCGVGVLSIALAERGFAVTATDTVPEMCDLTRQNAAERGVTLEVLFADA